jgi:RimJ/RimL family protein N-acetyltransferase
MRGMAASRPDPQERLEGTVVVLRELIENDLPALFTAIGRPEIFAGGWGGGMGAYREDFAQWSEFLRQWLPWQQGNVYAVCLRSIGDKVIGTTTLGDFDLKNESAHIGWTAYSPDFWGSGVNADAKRLLLNTAFTHGFERIRLHADVLNVRSRAAIERIGAQEEGVLRHVQRHADGSWRDTVIYSVLREEWPHVRSVIDERLAGRLADPSYTPSP